MKHSKVIELSHVLKPNQEEYVLNLDVKNMAEEHPQYKVDGDIWYIITDITTSSHNGTHIEMPYHHNKNGMDCSNFPLGRLITKAVMLDFSHKKNNESIEMNEILSHADRIKEGETVIFNFGVAKNFRTPEMHKRPFLSHEVAKWLADVKKVNIIGTDATGIEVRGEGERNQPNHQYLMDRQIPLIESMANLDELKEDGFTLFVLPIMIEGLDSCPVRVVAVY